MAVILNSYGGCWTVLLSLLVLSFARVTVCSSWWSLALVDDISLREVDTNNVLCNELHSVLNTTEQQAFCTYNREPLNYIAIGTRNGIVACQEAFADSMWNCTTFGGSHLFGSFVNNDTRETAVINALLAAGGERRLARACRDEKLTQNCTCRSIGTNGFQNGSFLTFDCAYDVVSSEAVMLNFLSQPNIDTTGALAKHNYMVGSHYVKQLKRKCRCIGFSGSCAAQSCHYLPSELETIAGQLRSRYNGASVQVNVSITGNNATLTPIVSNIHFNRTTDLVYKTTSPSFCTEDSNKGILGTSGRPCNSSNAASDACNVICCGRGYNTFQEIKQIECCQFVYCCRIECKVCRTETVYTYKCK